MHATYFDGRYFCCMAFGISCFFFVCFFFKPYLRMPISPTLVKCLRKDNLPLITAVCCQPTRQLSFVCALPHAHYGMLHHVM